ncbi:phage filamentation protein Fil family protein [Candidatus Fukatsuia symbiotica]|uniref:Uncharacterized protein n=1 Tax=Candidatus Fukatsuia symbiotica TaxID=1878942 RepID=A0A2U8I457_9GAMM|nr:phage filamentation protein Fil family protein [Candidatus Fukatsuia symbiotica]AWK13889.1 hypothetical protein CCS41_04425 [Candidatus Fukatsuia symbiotica]MEA9445776.1 phage filamentation protein Fil family protein [Candidatus Fukatsuia symbiotica]
MNYSNALLILVAIILVVVSLNPPRKKAKKKEMTKGWQQFLQHEAEIKMAVEQRAQRGWLETPDARHFQPKTHAVPFIKGYSRPFIVKPRSKRCWYQRLLTFH